MFFYLLKFKMYRGYFFYILVVFLLQKSEGQYEGDTCTSLEGFSGVCKIISQCRRAIEDIKNKKQPKVCGFVSTDTVVCCVEGSPPTVPPSTWKPVATTTPRPASRSISTTEYVPTVNDYVDLQPKLQCEPIEANKTAPRTGQKAWDKCIEYQEQYIYPCTTSIALQSQLVRGNNCRQSAELLIVNGINATDAEFPHMALLGFHSTNNTMDDEISFLCGGSVISDWYILTAGHCTSTKDGPVAFALLGTLKRSDDYDRTNLYMVGSIIKHPKYASPHKYHDIALLKTDRRIKLNSYVVPACLDVEGSTAERALATGWGAVAYRAGNSDTLQKVRLSKFSHEECFRIHGKERLMKNGIDPRTQVCYGDKSESKDTCQGDSGGPLQVNNERINCMYTIIGVTSFGRKCGVVGRPGIYTRVAEYVPWIESVVWP